MAAVWVDHAGRRWKLCCSNPSARSAAYSAATTAVSLRRNEERWVHTAASSQPQPAMPPTLERALWTALHTSRGGYTRTSDSIGRWSLGYSNRQSRKEKGWHSVGTTRGTSRRTPSRPAPLGPHPQVTETSLCTLHREPQPCQQAWPIGRRCSPDGLAFPGRVADDEEPAGSLLRPDRSVLAVRLALSLSLCAFSELLRDARTLVPELDFPCAS